MPSTAGTWREFIGGTINSSYLYSTTLKFSSAQPLSVLFSWRLYHTVWNRNLQIAETLNLIQSPQCKNTFSILQGQNKLCLILPSPHPRKWGILKDVRWNKPMLFINPSQSSAKKGLKMPIFYFSIDSKPFNSSSWPQISPSTSSIVHSP